MPDLQDVLSNIQPGEAAPEGVDENYADASEFPPPLPEGSYEFKQGKPSFEVKPGKKDVDGVEGPQVLAAVMDHEVIGGDQDGKVLRFDRIRSSTFERDGVKVSMYFDHLRAVGDLNPYKPSDYNNDNAAYLQALGQALSNMEGQTFKAKVKWEGYCPHCVDPKRPPGSKGMTTVRGMRNFPQKEDGTHATETECPGCPKEGRSGMVTASARINLRLRKE